MSPPAETRCLDDVFVAETAPAEVVSAIQSAAYARTTPLNVTLELSLRCNIRCLHCYNFDRDEPRGGACDDGRPELTLPEVLELMSYLREAGCLFLGLTGGEVLAYPHLFAVLERARELNFAVQLLTNGTLLRPGVAARLASYRNLMGMSVSLYGATPEVHDAITQVPGSFRRTWAGIDRMRALGVKIRAKLVVMRQNAHELAAWRAEAEARGIPYLIDLTVTSRHDGTEGSLATRIDDSQLQSVLAGPLRDLLPMGPKTVTEANLACNCARGNCAVTAKGDVTPCISVPWVAGNVREKRFIDIWKYAPVFQRIRGLRLADYPNCAPCPDKGYCTRERGAAYTASGSYTGVDPFVCRTAAVRREVIEGKARTASSTASTPANTAG